MPSFSDAAGGGGASMKISTTITTETGWHVLKIKKYSQTKGVVGVGNAYDSSAAFTVGGHRWCIKYFPDGYNEDGADCICFDLLLDDPAPKVSVKAKYVLSLLDRDGKPVPEHTAAVDVCEFSSEVPSWGLERFIEREELEASAYLKDDSFSVRCDVTVYDESGAKMVATTSPWRALMGFRFVVFFVALFVACWMEFMR